MTIEQALAELIESPEFKEAARTNVTYRVKLRRIRNGELKKIAAEELLKQFGYIVTTDVTKPKPNKK